LTDFWRQKLSGKILVLLYHRVIDGNDNFAFLENGGVPTIRKIELRKELKFLSDLGAKFLNFEDLRMGRFPSKNQFGVIVTFDDGFKDTYANGLSVVEEFGIRAVIFQSTEMLSCRHLLYEHVVYWIMQSTDLSLKLRNEIHLASIAEKFDLQDTSTHSLLTRIPFTALAKLIHSIGETSIPENLPGMIYPTPELLINAVEQGHQIGSHGHRHLHRQTISDEEFLQELKNSSQVLNDTLGDAKRIFSYPFGFYLPGDRRLVSKFFCQAATCEPILTTSQTDRYSVGRFSWPGNAKNMLRFRRWLLTGSI
jgi:peptidoglycan/xylan/chitin deacetylase (PgdA/CDA1 family)